MVSSVPYFSLKAVRIPRGMAYPSLVAAVLGLVVLLLYHEPVMFAIGMVYVLSGPVRLLARLRAERATDAARPLDAAGPLGAARPQDREPPTTESTRNVP
jgi:hypothetical protein